MISTRARTFILFAALISSASSLAAQGSSKNLDITFLANEGFLLQAGGKSVLIDALIREPYHGYAGLTSVTYQRMIDRKAPFESIQLALASHVHRDHFQAATAAAFLEQHPETLLISSHDVWEELAKTIGEDSELTGQTRAVWPDAGEVAQFEHDGAKVEIFRLRHGSERFYELQNLGQIVEIGGYTILHVGDAEILAEHYAPFDLPGRDLDAAIIPYWFWFEESGKQLIDEHLQARHLIAAHIPPKDLERAQKHFAENFPDVVVFAEPLEKRAF